MAEVCAAFGLGQSTASAKARVVSDALRTSRMNPTRNPLVWMAEVNRVLVDLHDMPREVQVVAHERGMTPASRPTGGGVSGSSGGRSLCPLLNGRPTGRSRRGAFPRWVWTMAGP
jgi:hypothetical protein